MENKQPISLKWEAGIWQLGHTWDIANPRILEKMGISFAPTPLLSFYNTEGGDRQEREHEIRVYWLLWFEKQKEIIYVIISATKFYSVFVSSFGEFF